MAQKNGWLVSAASALTAYLTATVLLNQIAWDLLPALTCLLLAIFFTARMIRPNPLGAYALTPPNWDLPARVIVATFFVGLLTTFAQTLGAQFSGLISTLPIFSVVFAAFTHAQQGSQAASNLLRGIVLSSAGYTFFFFIVGAFLPQWGIAATYAIALATLVLANAIITKKVIGSPAQ